MFVVQPGLVSRKNKYLVTAYCLREGRAHGVVLNMSEPRLKLVWVNGTWLSVRNKPQRNPSKDSAIRANRFVRGWTWLRLNGSAMSAIILFLGVPWYLGRSYVQLETVDQALYGDTGLIKRVNGLHNDVVWMKGFVSGAYGEKVVAQGYKKDEVKILPVRFSESQSIVKPLFQEAETASGRLRYNLEVALLGATSEEIVLSVSREFGGNDFKNNTVRVPLIVGTAVELTDGIYIQGMPRIFVTVLELPTQETAIVAIGPKELTRS
jgi:hypothetical protein